MIKAAKQILLLFFITGSLWADELDELFQAGNLLYQNGTFVILFY